MVIVSFGRWFLRIHNKRKRVVPVRHLFRSKLFKQHNRTRKFVGEKNENLLKALKCSGTLSGVNIPSSPVSGDLKGVLRQYHCVLLLP